MSYHLNNSELDKLFADAGAAVSKAKKTPKTSLDSPQSESQAQTLEPSPKNEASASVNPPKEKTEAERGIQAEQISGGTIDGESLNLTLKSGGTIACRFGSIKNLSAGRIGSEQITGWIYGQTIYFAVYRDINLKGLVNKMSFSISENWKAFINMMAEKTNSSPDPGLPILKKAVGVLPAYETREAFFEHIMKL